MSDSTVVGADEIIEIDRSKPGERYRWTCPNGHTSWAPTNSHAWCHGCHRQSENGADVHPEHYELLDQRTGESIPYARVELVE